MIKRKIRSNWGGEEERDDGHFNSPLEFITSGASTGPQTNTIDRLRLEMKKKTRTGKRRSSSLSLRLTLYIFHNHQENHHHGRSWRWNKHCFPISNRVDWCLCESSILVRLYVISYLPVLLSFFSAQLAASFLIRFVVLVIDEAAPHRPSSTVKLYLEKVLKFICLLTINRGKIEMRILPRLLWLFEESR